MTCLLLIPGFYVHDQNEIDSGAENFMTKVRITTEYSNTVETGKVIRFEINDDRVVNEVRRQPHIHYYFKRSDTEALL